MTHFLRLNSITATIGDADDPWLVPFSKEINFSTNPKWGNSRSTSGDFQKTVDTNYRNNPKIAEMLTEIKGISMEQATLVTTQKTTQKILELVRQNPRLTRKDLSDALGITEDGIKFHLARLKKEGLLRRIGPDKGGHWEIVKR